MPLQSVDRAIAVLRSFSIGEPVLGVTELSQRLRLHKSTVHRLLTSLTRGGLVERDARTRKYRLGIGLIELGNTSLLSRKMPPVVLPYLSYLADTVEEITYLAVRMGDEIVNLLQVPSPHLVQSVHWLGRAPLHCTSTGKIFLAHMAEEELEEYLEKPLTRMTPKSVTDPTDLRGEVERARELGFATAWEESEEGVNAVAVPISHREAGVVAAIGVVGPSYRFTREKALGSLDTVRSITREVSEKVGALPVNALQLGE